MVDFLTLIKDVSAIKENWHFFTIILLYFIFINLSKIKEGLGIKTTKRSDYEKEKLHYELVKLKYEIEVIKQTSGLAPEILNRIEAGNQKDLEKLKNPTRKWQFTGTQKFLAIPLIILILAVGASAYFSNETQEAKYNTIVGVISVALFIIVGFWGIPQLRRVKSIYVRKFGFIIIWFFGIYIGLMFIIGVTVGTTKRPIYDEDLVFSIAALVSLLLSVSLVLLGKLPGTRKIVE